MKARILALLFAINFAVAGFSADDQPNFQLPEKDDGLPGDGPIRRYDWFKNLWVSKRTGWAARREQDHGAVVLLGDSITQGWGEDFSAYFPGMKIANRGISGDTSRGVLIRLKEDVLDLDPAAVVLLIGTNDLEEKAAPETIAGNLKLIVAELEKHSKSMPIVLCEVFPSSEIKSRPMASIKAINKLYSDAVRGDKQITRIETWTLFSDPQGDSLAGLFPDRLHLNRAGYDKWAAALRPIFSTLGYLESNQYEWVPEPGFESIFNGKDLTGWGFRKSPENDRRDAAKPNAPAWPIYDENITFDGKTESNDGRYVAKNGRLIVTTPTEGRRIQQLWTTREFGKDFTLRLEFRCTPNADSGVFLRGNQLQCRDYPLAGPYKTLKNYRPGDWNELEMTVKGNAAYCLCNGELLEAAMKVPASGPIGLEGDRGQLEYRRIRVKME